MLGFVVRRLLQLVPVLFGLSVLLFIWVRALPGDPARALLGRHATPEAVADVRARLGLDKSLPEQYVAHLKPLFSGDFGRSISDGRPVLESFFDKLPATLQLGAAALLIAVVVGIPLGYLAARHQGRWPDTLLVSGSLLGVVTPVFFVAILLRLVFADWLHWLPTGGQQDPRIDATHVTDFYVLDGILTREWDAAWDAFVHLILPAIALGTMAMAYIARITRASVIEVLGEDYVRTARSKGLSVMTVSRRHVLRNALLAVVTTVGLMAGMLLSGAVLTETVFNFTGIGHYLFEAISTRDYPVIEGFVLLIAVFYSLINLAVDVAYGVIDPRVRLS
ncbi:peptide ABC transporter permease [Streptomyces viridiviolaceus]|uniref:ABC transporter permease n=1 Tax=Streptomyces viridiviolaceus TaxID=68282 RepID=A0ABW2E5Y7_9ACTN|nr:ABC transporter permease [Streptomyces viridiviolaceus]GHB56908.1 peptide ABC transporter permease [Streptomyces viridiviolaceus]